MKYKIKLKIADDTYEAEGATIKAAIKRIKPKHYKIKGLMTVSDDKKEVERLLPIWYMRKLFGAYGKTTQIIAEKSLKTIMR